MSKANPRGYRQGSIYHRESDGLWVGSIELPTIAGKRRRKVVTGHSEKEVKAKLNFQKGELERHGDLPSAGQTLESWLNVWFETIALKKIRPNTASVYRYLLERHIIPTIGTVKLNALTPAHIRRVETAITTTPKDPKDPSKGTLSSTTAAQAHRILAVALKYAEREGRITRNVATLTDAPRRAKTRLGVLDAADGLKVLQAVSGDRLGSRWAAALLTGARQGELLGLELDRVTDVLDLSWQLQRLSWEHGCKTPCGAKRGAECPNRTITAPPDWEHRYLTGGMWLSRPKSSAGWRIIPLVDPLRTIIERRIEAAASEPNPFGLLWTSGEKIAKDHKTVLELDGSPIDPAVDNRAWHAVLKRAGVQDVRLHDARHTAASLLLDAGVPEPIIMKILGHSSAVVTRGYQNIDRRQLTDAMTRLSEKYALPPGDAAPQ
jgi:integrase